MSIRLSTRLGPLALCAAAALTGCGGESDCLGGYIRDAVGNCVLAPGGATGDSATGSVGGDSGGGGDSGDSGGVSLSQSGPVRCEDPGLRDSLGPLERVSPGSDWSTQDYVYPDDQVAGAGVTVADLTGDGLYEIVLAHYGQDQLYVGQPDGSFTDETAARWPDVSSKSAATIAADIEGDGDLDLYICNMWGDDALLINDGSGHFSDGTAAAGLAGMDRRCMGATFGDMDGDGDLDLYVADYLWCFSSFDEASGQETAVCDHDPETLDPRSLWENQGDGRFVDVSERLPRDILIHALSHGAIWLDVDGDGDLDLYQVNDYRSEIEWVEPNHLFLNDGAGNLSEASESHTDVAAASMGLGVGDLNGDELPDLLISDTERVTLLESLGPLDWVETALSRGLVLDSQLTGREAGWGNVLVDLDNDGDLDAPMLFGRLFVQGGDEDILEQPDAIFLQGGDGLFEQVGESWGFADTAQSRSLATIDIDGDGWVDLLRGALDEPAALYRSRCGEAHWLEVHLRDAGPNTYAVGAVVRIRAGDQAGIDWVVAGGTSLHTSLQPLTRFGLGGAETVDTIEVTWPDGEVSVFNDIKADQRLFITRE